MARDGLKKRKCFPARLLAAGILAGTMLLAAALLAPVLADESISISCYKDAKSTWPVGTVAVYDVAAAAATCNSLYYECRGRCIGCYHDFDYIDNVCVDMRGNTFLK